MKILLVNKFYYLKGGSENYLFSLQNVLREKGNETIQFSMKDERNYDSEHKQYFVENIDYQNTQKTLHKVKIALKLIYSLEAKKKIKQLIENQRPDIAHLHIFQHQLSSSIIFPLKKSIPIVYTMHDLKPVCANYKMLSNNNICEKCKGNKHYNCLLQRCVKDSYLKSFINTIEMYVYGILKVYDLIDKIIVPSKFYFSKLKEFGIKEDKIVYIPNFVDAKDFEPSYKHQNYFLYVGRLSEEKGLKTLINSTKHVDNTMLYIVGTGPLEPYLKKFIKNNSLDKKIKMLGFKSGSDLQDLIKNAMFGIIPSEWYENCPYSVLEMMAYGKPVVGSNIGGIPELIDNNSTGLLFEKGNEVDLANKITTLLKNKEMLYEFGKKAREKVERHYNKEYHYKKINEVYSKLLEKRS